MLVRELMDAAGRLPPDAHVSVYVEQDVPLSADEWNGGALGCLSDYFEVDCCRAEREWDGALRRPCLTIVTGRTVG